MPVYEYENEETGETIELCQPVEKRDNCPAGFHRVTVPRRLNVVGLVREPTCEDLQQKACRDLEEKIGIKELERQTGFTARQLKHHWFDRADAPEAPSRVHAEDAAGNQIETKTPAFA